MACSCVSSALLVLLMLRGGMVAYPMMEGKTRSGAPLVLIG